MILIYGFICYFDHVVAAYMARYIYTNRHKDAGKLAASDRFHSLADKSEMIVPHISSSMHHISYALSYIVRVVDCYDGVSSRHFATI